MKKLLFSLFLLLTATTATLWAQAPQRISYQSIVRDGSNVVVASTAVGIKISVLRGTATAPPVYVETHRKTTNPNGLVSLEIGEGTVLTGRFVDIDWANGPYLIRTETDPTGGTNYSITGIAPLNSVPYALYAANGTPGPKGDKGDTGATGTTGAAGLPGVAGPQGERGITGATGAIGPQGLPGVAGEAGPTGATGPAGPNGINGLDGKTILNGTTNPTSQGVNGDFYINTTSNTIFGPKASGVWPSGVSLVGPIGATGIQGIQGIQGATGSDGIAGTNGLDGKTVLNGTSNPATGQGVNGDFYINTATNTLFGPKASGAWPTGVSLVGPTGATGIQGIQGVAGTPGTNGTNGLAGPAGTDGAIGANGLDGKTVLNGTINPTSQGVNGDFYINTTSNTIFGPKASGVWPSGVSLIGIASIGAISGTSTANGASITSGELNLAPANATNGGIVTTGAQTFAGAKTFSSNLTASGFAVVNGASSQFLKANGTVDATIYVPKNTSAISIGSNAAGSDQGSLAVAMGSNAGNNTQGDNAVAIGANAGLSSQGLAAVAMGSNAGNTTQGDNAVAIGLDAGFTNQGINAIAIGTKAGETYQPANSIILNASGSPLDAAGTGFFVMPIRQSSSFGNILTYDQVTGEITYSSSVAQASIFNNINSNSILTGSLTMTSDRRLKDDIKTLPSTLDIIKKMNPVSYKKKDSIALMQYTHEEMGFIAQEIQKVLPMLVIEGSDKDKTLSVNYISLIPLLTKAIQEQQTQIEEKAKLTDELKKQLDRQQKEIDELRELIKNIKK